MKTPQWEKKLGGHAGELYVAAELSKRGIPNALLPENFTGDDIIVGTKDGTALAFVQVKSCHPDRASSFILNAEHEAWVDAPANQFVVFVWLGSPKKNEPPRYWVVTKAAVGEACVRHSQHTQPTVSGGMNWERRFWLAHDKHPEDVLDPSWENAWGILTVNVTMLPEDQATWHGKGVVSR